MRIEKINIDRLNPAKYNPRVDLSPDSLEYAKIKRSIQEFNYIDPIIWNDTTGNVVGGHQRLKVLKDLGYEEIEVSVVSLSEEKEKILNVALNKIAGEWDIPKLEDLLTELSGGKIDLLLTGFDQDEISKLIVDIDSFEPEPPRSSLSQGPEVKCPHCGNKFFIEK